MGFRTVLTLSNDWSDKWRNDPDLGKKIQNAAYDFQQGTYSKNPFPGHFQYGTVSSVAHADTVEMLVSHHYAVVPINKLPPKEIPYLITNLKYDLNKLGYTIIKKAVKK